MALCGHLRMSLIVLQFRNVLVEVQGSGVGKGPPLRHLSAGNHLFDCHFHLFAADGVLRRKRGRSRQGWLLQETCWQIAWLISAFLTGMSPVSSTRAGTCRADRALRMAPLIFVTKSWEKTFPSTIFRNKITLSSPSELYWGTQRLSDTSSKASTVGRKKIKRSPVYS